MSNTIPYEVLTTFRNNPGAMNAEAYIKKQVLEGVKYGTVSIDWNKVDELIKNQ